MLLSALAAPVLCGVSTAIAARHRTQYAVSWLYCVQKRARQCSGAAVSMRTRPAFELAVCVAADSSQNVLSRLFYRACHKLILFIWFICASRT